MIRPWRATEPLHPGTTLLEASAGTGKTWNITNLVLRLVVERNLHMKEVVVVTFTNAATADLSKRVHERLEMAEAALSGRRPLPDDDAVLVALRDGGLAGDISLAQRVRRLRRALVAFDECTIRTIHGFCQQMLQQHAFESGADFELELIKDTRAPCAQLVDDFLSRELYAVDAQTHAFLVNNCGFSREKLMRLAETALSDPDIDVWPQAEDSVTPAQWPALRDAFAVRWRDGGSERLVAAFPSKKNGPAQVAVERTQYLAGKVARHVAAVDQWLAEGPEFGSQPAKADYWSAKAMTPYLLDAGAILPAELLELRQLLAFADTVAACRKADFVRQLRLRFRAQLASARQQTYDDLLLILAARLGQPGPPREALVAAIGGRFKAALIDEFQDTDNQQWTIFSALFGAGQHFLYLIGDPKQAIYGFRGANVQVYLAARRSAGERVFTMAVNWRSDQRLLDACNAVMARPDFFGEAAISYVPVAAPPGPARDFARLRFGTDPSPTRAAPLQLRLVDGRLRGDDPPDEDKRVTKGALTALLPDRVADDIVDLLEAEAQVHDPDHPSADGDGFRSLRPGDIAVLVRTGKQAVAVQRALGAANVPAVLSGAESVLASDAARELELWLAALAAPGRDGVARAAATTRIFGRDGALLAGVEANDPTQLQRWSEWLGSLAQWRLLFEQGGVLRALDRAMEQENVAGRLLGRVDGERRLTNLLHVAELLHGAEAQERLGLMGLLAWLRRQRQDARLDAELAELRLERDDAAVRVLTKHKAKGLEFRVVFLPFLWAERKPGSGDLIRCAHPGQPTQRLIDLRVDNAASAARQADEDRREAVRLLYVAMTRARHRCVLYTGHINGLEHTPLAPALHGEPRPADSGPMARFDAGRQQAAAPRSALEADLLALVQAASRGTSGPAMALSICLPPSQRRWPGEAPSTDTLQVRDFLRTGVVGYWRRHSYSALRPSRRDAAVDPALLPPDPRQAEGADFDAEDLTAADLGASGAASPSPGSATLAGPVTGDGTGAKPPTYGDISAAPLIPLADFPAGADAGTFLHEVLEHVDFRAAAGLTVAPERTLAAVLAVKMAEHGFAADRWGPTLLAALTRVLATPLGGPLGATRLCDIAPDVRFDELRFDFPLAGGADYRRERDAPVARDAIAGALRRRVGADHRSDNEAALRGGYLERLSTPQRLAGFMTGSVDLIFRHPVDGVQKWWLVDYKSNRLDPERQGRYCACFYDRPGLRHAMEQHDYPLQYHIYTAALDRYLRWRMGPDWAYDPMFGGVYYLFLRGMVGPDTAQEAGFRHGCFFDRPPAMAIAALQRAFAGGAAADPEARP